MGLRTILRCSQILLFHSLNWRIRLRPFKTVPGEDVSIFEKEEEEEKHWPLFATTTRRQKKVFSERDIFESERFLFFRTR